MTEDDFFKTPPHSIESEQAVIGGLLLDNEKLADISALLMVDDFYTLPHRLIYDAILELSNRNTPFDVVTVIEMLASRGQLQEVGDKTYLIDLVTNTPGSVNIHFYAQTIRDKSILRSLIAASNEIAEASYFPQGKDIRDVLDFAESKVMSIAEQGANKQREYQTIQPLLQKAVMTIDERFNNDGGLTGLATKYTKFDELTSGLQNGDLIIVAGRPSMGKTTFSMNLAENIALQNHPVAVFSMEMPSEQLVLRMISSVGRIKADRIRTGRMEGEDFTNLTRAAGQLAKTQIYIDDTPALRITDLRARARRIDKDIRDAQLKAAKAELEAREAAAKEAGRSLQESERLVPEDAVTGLRLIVIDYLQLMRGSTNTDNRVNEISEISRGLKAIAKELELPVIALSQLSRNLEQRPDKRPKMSDLRESGAIEQDADLILFIYRDEVYNPDVDNERKGEAEIIVGKHRNGSLDTVYLTFLGEYTKFENHIRLDEAEQYY